MRLIDADALRKHFEVPHELKCGIQAGMDEYALKCIDEQPTVAASPWHRCEDELPPAHENLLCCGSRGGMFVGWVLGSAVCICGSCTGFVHGGKGRQFTHWMPLPEPPKEEMK